MFEGKFPFEGAVPAQGSDCLAPIHAMLSLLQDFAPTAAGHLAVQYGISGETPVPLAARYAAANSITRRRFDAIVREAETVGTIGLRLLISRGGRSDRGTIAAARFLGNSIEGVIRKLENLVPPRAV